MNLIDGDKKMYVVVDHESGLIYCGDDRTEAEQEYQLAKSCAEEYVQDNNEFDGEEMVILGVINKHFYSRDTGKMISADGRNTYWEFVEEEYSNSFAIKEDTQETIKFEIGDPVRHSDHEHYGVGRVEQVSKSGKRVRVYWPSHKFGAYYTAGKLVKEDTP